VAGELTYGLERLAMYVQGVENVFDLNFNGRDGAQRVSYGDVFLQAEQEFSRHNFEFADTDMLFEQFRMAEAACKKYLEAGWTEETIAHEPPEGYRDNPLWGRFGSTTAKRHHLMALPAYDQCIKASHVFNLLDARGVISVTERQSYILRVRDLAKACGEAWLATEGGGAT
jgi:glycyl-tRNA synthetase alpha chain